MVNLYFSLAVLSALFLVQIFKRKFSFKFARFLFFFSVSFLFLQKIYFSFSLYEVWKSNPLTERFLPPFAGWRYFLFFSFSRFFVSFLVVLIFSVLIFLLIEKINTRFNRRFFYREESFLAATSVLLSGFPGFIFFFLLVLIFHLFISFLSLVFFKFFKSSAISESPRVSFLFLWVPSAFFVIITSNWLSQFDFWKALQFSSFNF